MNSKINKQFTQIFNSQGCTDRTDSIQTGNSNIVIKLSSLKKRENLRVTNEINRGRSERSLHTRNKVSHTMLVYLWAVFRKYSRSSYLVLSKLNLLTRRREVGHKMRKLSKKDPNNYHSLNSVIWLYKSLKGKENTNMEISTKCLANTLISIGNTY